METTNKTFVPVVAVEDNDGHWYVINAVDKEDFFADLDDYELCESGEFDAIWGKFKTGGDLNLIQLYALR